MSTASGVADPQRRAGLMGALQQQFSRLEIEPKRPPGYVAVIASRVFSDSEGEDSSSSSSEDDDGTFTQATFDQPKEYYRMHPVDGRIRRGSIVNSTLKRSKVKAWCDGEPASPLLINLFDKEVRKQPNLEGRLAVSLGFNKMRSIRKKRNGALERRVNAFVQNRVPVRACTFMWDGVWEKSVSDGKGGRCWQEVAYDEVRKFYRQLKKKNKERSKVFVKGAEKSRAHMIPYREIRDTVKNSDATKAGVNIVRGNSSRYNRDTYLVFMDDDMQSLRQSKEAAGAFTVFDSHYEESGFVIGSTGYVVETPDRPFVEMGVLADLLVRNSTAKHIKTAPYYPEPSTAVKVPSLMYDTVPENFSSPGDRNYIAPQEMPRLMDAVLAQRDLDPQESCFFDATGAITTTLPARMNRELSGIKMSKGLVLWGLSHFEAIRGTSQCHYKSRAWAKNLVRCLSVESEIEMGGNLLRDIAVIRDQVMVSLLSRLFASFDPVEIAKREAGKKGISFQLALIRVLQNYGTFLANVEVAPAIKRKKRKPLERANNQEEAQVKADTINKLWEWADGIKTIPKLVEGIKIFLVEDVSELVEAAAKDSCKAVARLFADKLCLDYKKQVASIIAKIKGISASDVERDMPKAYEAIILGGSVEEGKKAAFKREVAKVKPSTFYDITPLEMAALSGDVVCFDYLARLKKFSSPLKNGKALEAVLSYCAFTETLYTPLIDAVFLEQQKDGAMLAAIKSSGLSKDAKILVLDYLIRTERLKSIIEDSETTSEDSEITIVDAIKAECDSLAYAIEEKTGYEQSCNDVLDVMFEMAPDVDQALINWANERDVSWYQEIREDLSESEQILFDISTGVHEDVYPEDPMDEYELKREELFNQVINEAGNASDKLLYEAQQHGISFKKVERHLYPDEVPIFRGKVKTVFPSYAFL